MEKMEKARLIPVVAVALIAGSVIGYWLGSANGDQRGYDRGYKQAELDIKALEQAAAKKAAEETAKAANPFQTVNPLEGVEANPFEKAKKVLNPFE